MTEREADRLAEQIVSFWTRRGIAVKVRVVRYYQDWFIESSLTGKEPCEIVRVRPVVESHN